MHAKPSRGRKTKKKTGRGTVEMCGAETAVFATLGVAAMIAIALAVLSASIPARTGPQPYSFVEKSSIVKYFGSGQLAADARTLVNMAHYLIQPESSTTSNASASWSEKSTAVSTNHAGSPPKA